MTSLRQCPFCGDNPRITAFYGYDDGDIYILENSSEGEFIRHDWRSIRKRPSDDGGWYTNAGVTCECGMRCMWEIPIEPVRYEDWSEQGEALVSDLCRKIAERWNRRVLE